MKYFQKEKFKSVNKIASAEVSLHINPRRKSKYIIVTPL